MAKQFIREVKPYANLYKDTVTGIAWIEDGSTGCGHSCHPNIDSTGSVTGMKKLGYWNKKDRIVRSHGFQYNIDKFVIDTKDEFDIIVAKECACAGCQERREAPVKKFKGYLDKWLEGETVKEIPVTLTTIRECEIIHNALIRGEKPAFINGTVKKILDECGIKTVEYGIGWRVL